MTSQEELRLWREFGQRLVKARDCRAGTDPLEVLAELAHLMDWAQEKGLLEKSLPGLQRFECPKHGSDSLSYCLTTASWWCDVCGDVCREVKAS